jgi:hypothetical protein
MRSSPGRAGRPGAAVIHSGRVIDGCAATAGIPAGAEVVGREDPPPEDARLEARGVALDRLDLAKSPSGNTDEQERSARRHVTPFRPRAAPCSAKKRDPT